MNACRVIKNGVGTFVARGCLRRAHAGDFLLLGA